MNYLDQIKVLQDQGQPFVLATVVRIEKPTSAKPGAKAIITPDGSLTGWIGGSCAEPTVKREALKALQDGKPRLLRLCPPEKMGVEVQEGVTEMQLTCMSGGTMEIYLDSHLTQPHLVVIGHQAAAEALAALGKTLEYRVTVLGEGVSAERFPGADRVIEGTDFAQLELTPNTYVVVASHGNYDEPALEAALPSRAAYVAIVASKKRAEAVRDYLRGDGLSEEALARLRAPAGLDIGALTPPEIALSILAEIVQEHRQGVGRGPIIDPAEAAQEPETALDPVCGMTVEVASASLKTAYQGQTIYFCSAHCQRLFEKTPEAYLHPAAAGENVNG